MKLFIINSIYIISNYYYFLKFKLYLNFKINNKSRLWILDIDNTLADTWPHLKTKLTLKSLYPHLPVISEVDNYFKKNYNVKSDSFIFLSARSFIFRKVTINWLANHGFLTNPEQLFLVKKASDKIKFIEYASFMFEKIIVLDDLTYNHEHGEIMFHFDVIKFLHSCKKNVTYLDNEFISNLRHPIN